jgi:hypothetical protein
MMTTAACARIDGGARLTRRRVIASSRDAVRLIEARVLRPSRANALSRARFERANVGALGGAREASVGEGTNGIGRTRIERRRRTCARASERTRVRLCERYQRTTLVEFRW